MRVKYLIAMAIASIFLLVNVIPAGAVIGVTGVNSNTVNVGAPVFVPPVVQSAVVPCVSFPAPIAPGTNAITANTIVLGGPALQSSFTLFAPQSPTFAPPNFVLQQLTPPSITPFIATAPVFDP